MVSCVRLWMPPPHSKDLNTFNAPPPEKKNSSPQWFEYFALALFFGDRYLTKHFEIFCNNMNFGLIYRTLIPQKYFKLGETAVQAAGGTIGLPTQRTPNPQEKPESSDLFFGFSVQKTNLEFITLPNSTSQPLERENQAALEKF